MTLPRTIIMGSGRRRWRLHIQLLPLSDFLAAYQRVTREKPQAPLDRALWSPAEHTIYLRADRTAEQQLLDLKHELDHAYVDWRDMTFPDSRD